MKTALLAILAATILSTSAFAADKHSAVAADTRAAASEISAPNVSGLPDALKRAVLWAAFLTSTNGNLTALDMSRGVRFVSAQMDRYGN